MFFDVQYPNVAPGEAGAVGVEADVSIFFYNYMHEPTASWFGVDLRWDGQAGPSTVMRLKASLFPQITSCCTQSSDDCACVGWSRAFFLANEAVA